VNDAEDAPGSENRKCLISFAVFSTQAPPASSSPSASATAVADASAPAALPVIPPPTSAPAPSAPRTTAKAPAPPTAPAPQQKPTCGAPPNPFGYNFCGTGGYVYSPAAGVCTYFQCIANFTNGHGYLVECIDGKYSKSGGVSGACSRHGGESRPVLGG
jgi:hypothetical protein